MSYTIALSNAASGLRANAKMAETLSSNIANALTEGYARREVNLSAQQLDGSGRGVQVSSITTVENKIATVARRNMSAQNASDTIAFDATGHINTALGDVNSPLALARMMGELEASFVAAGNAPENLNFVRDIAQRANEITDKFSNVSADYQRIRQDADTNIAFEVEKLNFSLSQIERLNEEISKKFHSADDVSGFQAERARLIDDVSEMVPVNVISKDRGRIALFTAEGGTLLDYYRTEFSFTPTPIITPDLTAAAGDLSMISVNGTPTNFLASNGVWAGGKLEALMRVRDETVPQANAQLDGLARDLVERFQDPAVDPTLGATDAGIFTDAGGWFDVANEVGLAGRLELNSLVAPNSGELWRMQSGLNAVTPLNSGNATILANYADAIGSPRAGNPGLGTSVALSAAGFAGKITADAATVWGAWEARSTYSATQAQILEEKEANSVGVDTDSQLQMLIEVENAYAANARVMRVLDEMLARLMEI